MLKIDRKQKNNSPAILFNTVPGRVSSTNSTHSKKDFAEDLKISYTSQFRDEIEQLILQLDKNGRRFAENPSAENLRVYKRDIQSFLYFVNKRSYHVKEVYGRRIDYKIVQTINEQLEELSKEVISREIPRMALLAKIDEIRGLIIDLIL